MKDRPVTIVKYMVNWLNTKGIKIEAEQEGEKKQKT